MKSLPDWYEKVIPALVAGRTQADAAREAGISARALRRHLSAPGSVLKAHVEQERAALASAVQDESKDLLSKALAVLATHLDGEGKLSLDAAKAVLGKLLPDKATVKAEEQPAPEATAEEACREVTLALASFADLARTGQLSVEAVAGLRSACVRFIEDDLKPRPPIDTEADRVELLGEVEGLAEPSTAVGGLIPIRH